MVGRSAGRRVTSGRHNTLIGQNSGINLTTQEFNVFVGSNSGLMMQGPNSWENTFLGEHSGFRFIEGHFNTFLGNHTAQGSANARGDNNTIAGAYAGQNITNASNNSIFGTQSGVILLTGQGNSYFGYRVGLFNNDGDNNTFIGSSSGDNHNIGSRNIAIGFNSGQAAGSDLGTNNIFIGVNSGESVAALTRAGAIGDNALVTGSNEIILGGPGQRIGIGLSGNILGPQDFLEIDGQVLGVSGLQLRQIPASTVPVPNPGAGVLAVDSTGRVIYVDTASVAGGDDDWYVATTNNIPAAITDEIWTDASAGIGSYFGSNNPRARFHIHNHDTSIFFKDTMFIARGLSPASAATIIGVVSEIITASPGQNIAGYFNAPGMAGIANTSIFVPQGGGIVTIGYPTTGNTGDDVEILGNLNLMGDHNGFGNDNYSSDAMIKTNINSFNEGLNIVRQLEPVTFEYNGLAQTPTGKEYVGVIANDVVQFAPYAIDTVEMMLDTNATQMTELLTVANRALLFTIVNAVKELDSANTAKDSLIHDLQSQINQCCTLSIDDRLGHDGTGEDINEIAIELQDAGAILYQNIPNPFGKVTTINYFVPENTTQATMVFYDDYGRVLKQVTLTENGNGKVEINASDLSNGIYTYSLEVDGQVIGTKRMVRSR